MKIDVKLPPIFNDGNVCRLYAFLRREHVTPQRTYGSPWHQTKLSAMKEQTLHLTLEDETYLFIEARKQIQCCLWHRPLTGPALTPVEPWKMISIHVVKAATEKSLLFVDEHTDNLIGVINDSFHWDIEGLDVAFQR